MKILSTSYDAPMLEKKWYSYWQSEKLFESTPDAQRTPYTVVMPPPNVTGILHMGHVLNNTIQDILVRRARMQGREVCWVPGLDHASIATEAKVVDKLKAEGIDKKKMGREAFLQHAWEWKEKYGGRILEQCKALGLSCDWRRTTFTMDPQPSKAVREAFIRLYKDGLIYRAERMIHWDPMSKTALADDEVIYRTIKGALYYIEYEIVGEKDRLIVATTRPETLFGDVAVAVHPQDERYKKWIGKCVRLPLIAREIPIIADSYVDPHFGTGCLKITPSHDVNDYQIALRHELPLRNVIDEEARICGEAGIYIGMDRFDARKQIVEDLQQQGVLYKIESHLHQVGHSERTDAVVEPRISLQWFVNMEPMAKPALNAVSEGKVQFHPKKMINSYRVWLEQIQNWCISRQLWWGHRIPVYYLPDGKHVVAHSLEEAVVEARKIIGWERIESDELKQDEDVLDTWFSSWLWPFSIFGGLQEKGKQELDYYYPTEVVVTAPEIIFFWIARMIMAGQYFIDQVPFKHVYFTGIVRDKQRRKMSKSLGNSPDPIDLINQYGADGVRAGMLFSSPAGNDLLFDERLCVQGKQFAHKLWHAARLISGWTTDDQEPISSTQQAAIDWYEVRLSLLIEQCDALFDEFKISEVLITLYRAIWDDFCARYLEMVKPADATGSIASEVREKTSHFFKIQLQLLHPFMPFITEELWSLLDGDTKSIAISPWPSLQIKNEKLIKESQSLFELVARLRHLRKEYKKPKNQVGKLSIKGEVPRWVIQFEKYIRKETGISAYESVKQLPDGPSFVINGLGYGLTDWNQVKGVDRNRLVKELEHANKLLKQVENKLNNSKFMKHANPDVIAREEKKKQDAKQKIKELSTQLA